MYFQSKARLYSRGYWGTYVSFLNAHLYSFIDVVHWILFYFTGRLTDPKCSSYIAEPCKDDRHQM
jgi:hypothetical protein